MASTPQRDLSGKSEDDCPRLFTTDEAARVLGVSAEAVEALVREGDLKVRTGVTSESLWQLHAELAEVEIKRGLPEERNDFRVVTHEFSQIPGFLDGDEYTVLDVQDLCERLIEDGSLDVSRPLDERCPACDIPGWVSRVDRPHCEYCGFGFGLDEHGCHLARDLCNDTDEEVRRRAFLYRISISAPLIRDSFGPFHSSSRRAVRSLPDEDSSRGKAILSAVDSGYRRSLKLLADMGVEEDIQFSQMLCVHVGAVAMSQHGGLDPDWLIHQTAAMFESDDLANHVSETVVLDSLRSFFHASLKAAREMSPELAHLCQLPLMHQYGSYAEDPAIRTLITKCAADIDSLALVSSVLFSASSRTPEGNSNTRRSLDSFDFEYRPPCYFEGNRNDPSQGEVVIACITSDWEWGETLTVRAAPSAGRIRYRVEDQIACVGDTAYVPGIEQSAEPLTFREVVQLIDGAGNGTDCLPGAKGPALAACGRMWQRQVHSSELIVRALQVRSEVYPELETYYNVRFALWLADAEAALCSKGNRSSVTTSNASAPPESDVVFDGAVRRMQARTTRMREEVLGPARNSEEQALLETLREGYLRLDAMVRLDESFDGVLPPSSEDLAGREVVMNRWRAVAHLFE